MSILYPIDVYGTTCAFASAMREGETIVGGIELKLGRGKGADEKIIYRFYFY